jgi:hypothetical protein
MRIALAILVLAGCSHTQTEGLTAAQNRNEASVHEGRAAAAQAQLDPEERRGQPRPWGPGNEDRAGLSAFSPTEQHQQTADRELRAAADHLRAAKSLEAFEDEACAGLPASDRAACPLLGSSVVTVQQTTLGFALVLKPQVDVAQTFQRLSCHLAFARAVGFTQPSCPLFVQGTSLRRVGAQAIGFAGDSAEVTATLQAQARRVFGGWASEPSL